MRVANSKSRSVIKLSCVVLLLAGVTVVIQNLPIAHAALPPLIRVDTINGVNPSTIVCPTNPLTSPVKFFLHDTFNPDTICVVPRQGVAQLDLRAVGAFTVGAITDGGNTSLELDLEFLEGAPEKFRAR